MKGDDSARRSAISRGRLDAAPKLVDAKEIFVADAWENARMAFNGRMEFGPDKTLYVSVGDRDRLCCGPQDDNSIRIRAQCLADHVGKILRLKDDGTAPADNPFVGRAGAKPEIFTYGHRNSYGLRFHPETGELWQMEIGPHGRRRDQYLEGRRQLRLAARLARPELHRARSSRTSRGTATAWSSRAMFWVPQISPAGMALYTGDKFPQWKNNLIVGALSGQHVERISFGNHGQAERREVLLDEMGLRFRDVEIGPDGFVYLATEVRYGSGQPDGTVIRLEPLE